MKKINIFIVIGIGIIIIVSGWIIFSDKIRQPVSQEEIGIPQENVEKETVLLIIDDSEGTKKTFEAEFGEGMTAFDVLKNKTDEFNIALKTKTYDIGIFIEAIGDKENGQDGKYWVYYINGEMPMVAADKKEIKPGDKIEFKFETP
jgi:hypothetical protein